MKIGMTCLALSFFSLHLSAQNLPIGLLEGEKHGSICGSEDDRVPSKILPIAKLTKKLNGGAGCTGTMISRTCMVSAGHCISVLKVAQFNVPMSDPQTGQANHSRLEDQYEIRKIFDYKNSGVGNDWAVMNLNENPQTGKLPGDVQGYYQFDFGSVRAGTTLRITGHGADKEKQRNYSQQTHTGPLSRRNGSTFNYTVDTEPGNSGSAIIRESDQKVVGVHTNGGCGWGTNSGTSFYNNTRFKNAVLRCLDSEEK